MKNLKATASQPWLRAHCKKRKRSWAIALPSMLAIILCLADATLTSPQRSSETPFARPSSSSAQLPWPSESARVDTLVATPAHSHDSDTFFIGGKSQDGGFVARIDNGQLAWQVGTDTGAKDTNVSTMCVSPNDSKLAVLLTSPTAQEGLTARQYVGWMSLSDPRHDLKLTQLNVLGSEQAKGIVFGENGLIYMALQQPCEPTEMPECTPKVQIRVFDPEGVNATSTPVSLPDNVSGYITSDLFAFTHYGSSSILFGGATLAGSEKNSFLPSIIKFDENGDQTKSLIYQFNGAQGPHQKLFIAVSMLGLEAKE